MARLAFIIRSLTGGGAERQLLALVRGLGSRGHICAIASWKDDLAYPEDLRDAAVSWLRVSPGDGTLMNVPFLACRIGCAVSRFRPDVIHGYLDDGNFFASTSRLWVPKARIAWGLRASDVDLGRYDRRGQLLARLNAVGARTADVLIVNSHAGAAHALKLGYPHGRLKVVPNGIDVQRFLPDPERRRRQREEWGVGEGVIVIGLAARLDPMKDHATFARAARMMADRRDGVRFICVGEGVEPYRTDALRELQAVGLGDRLLWKGFCRDMVAFYNGVDILSSTSLFGEGFSNAIGEAMACGTPCVVTDVGDSAWIVGATGSVVKAADPVALAMAWEQILIRTDPEQRAACRRRIVEAFSLDRLICLTESALGL